MVCFLRLHEHVSHFCNVFDVTRHDLRLIIHEKLPFQNFLAIFNFNFIHKTTKQKTSRITFLYRRATKCKPRFDQNHNTQQKNTSCGYECDSRPTNQPSQLIFATVLVRLRLSTQQNNNNK